MGHHIIMGRKTWESIGRLLPGRKHIIISRKPGYAVAGAKVVDSLEAAIAAARNDSEIFVIGGGEIYTLVLPIADRILATEVDGKFEGDTYFPELAEGAWRKPHGNPTKTRRAACAIASSRWNAPSELLSLAHGLSQAGSGCATTLNDSGASPA